MSFFIKVALIIFLISSLSCGRDVQETETIIEETEKQVILKEKINREQGDNGSINENENENEIIDDGNIDETHHDDLSQDGETDEIQDMEENVECDNNLQKEEEEDSIYIPPFPDLSEVHFSIKTYASNNQYHQSGACYGDYAVFVSNYLANFYFYNLKTRKFLYNLIFKMDKSKDFLGQTLYHCNQASFGTEFYDAEDPFPILYVSQHALADRRYFIEGYRILPIWSDEENEYLEFNVELVQTIYFPPMTKHNALGNVNMVIDSENNQMITYSRNNNIEDSNMGKCKISCFDIPSVHQKNVYLEDSEIKWSFYTGESAINMQGGCIKNGILYIAQGYKNAGYIYLNLIDLNKQQQTERLDLLNNGYSWEPEACFVFDENVMIGGGKKIYKVIIDL